MRIKIELNNDMSVLFENDKNGACVATMVENSSKDTVVRWKIDEQKLFEFLQEKCEIL